MFAFAKSHWEWLVAGGGMFATITLQGTIAILIGMFTLGFIACKFGIWLLKFRMTWRNRNNTNFFIKSNDDEDTET